MEASQLNKDKFKQGTYCTSIDELFNPTIRVDTAANDALTKFKLDSYLSLCRTKLTKTSKRYLWIIELLLLLYDFIP